MNYLDNRYIYFFLVIFLLATLSCCKKDEDEMIVPNPPANDYDRVPLLTNWTNNYIIPAYQEYATQTTNLKNEVASFTSLPSISSLQSVRTQWENTLLVWQDVAFLELGPAANISLRSQTNIYPADTLLINSNITSGTYDLDQPSNFDAKGFQAIDYLINGIAATDQDIVDFFASSANAATYIQDIVIEIDDHAIDVRDNWQNGFGVSFIANSASNAQGSAVSDVINAFVQHYETFVRKGKVGLPAGVFNIFSQSPLPTHVEALYYQQSLPFIHRSLTAIQKFIRGEDYIANTNGEGLDDYLSFVNAQVGGQPLEMIIDDQLNLIQAELTTINDPFSEEVVSNNAAVREVYQEIQRLVPSLKIDMTNALDVLITFQDSDGD